MMRWIMLNIIKNKPVEISVKKMLEDAWSRLEKDRVALKNTSELLEKCTAELLSTPAKRG